MELGYNIASVVYILVFGLEACGICFQNAIEPIYTLDLGGWILNQWTPRAPACLLIIAKIIILKLFEEILNL